MGEDFLERVHVVRLRLRHRGGIMKPGDLVKIIERDDMPREYIGKMGVIIKMGIQRSSYHGGVVEVYTVLINGCERCYLYKENIEVICELDEDA